MNPINTAHPHDAFYKSCMKDLRIAKDFFSHYLPTFLMDRIILDSAQIEDGTFIDQELKASATDILYSIDFKNKHKGYIYTLAEHQSTPEKMAPFRFMQYRMRIMKHHLNQNPEESILPIVYILVFYNGKKPYLYSTDFFDLFGENKTLAIQTFNEPFRLIDLSQLSDEELKSHRYSGMFEMAMKMGHARTITKQLLEILLYFSWHALDPHEFGDYYDRVIQYGYQFGGRSETQEFLSAIRGLLPKVVEDKAMTLAEQFEQHGVILGKAELLENLIDTLGNEKEAARCAKVSLKEFRRILNARKKSEEFHRILQDAKKNKQ